MGKIKGNTTSLKQQIMNLSRELSLTCIEDLVKIEKELEHLESVIKTSYEGIAYVNRILTAEEERVKYWKAFVGQETKSSSLTDAVLDRLDFSKPITYEQVMRLIRDERLNQERTA